MELLLLTPQLPFPPQQGTSLRNFYIIRGLAQRHRITLLSFVDDDVQAVPRQLDEQCDEVVVVSAPRRSPYRRLWQMVTSTKPDMSQRLFSRAFGDALQTVLTERAFDMVQVEGIEMAWTIPFIRAYSANTSVVYDAHNAETVLQARSGAAEVSKVQRWPAVVYSWLQQRRLATYEAWVLDEADGVTAVSEADKKVLENLTPQSKTIIEVIPNSIDIEQYAGDTIIEKSSSSADAPRSDILFSGKMDYRPNVDAVLWFASEVWPLIIKARPETTWVVAGQKPHARLDQLRSATGVTVTGWVPEMAPYIAASKVVIMPFRIGSGTRLKLIEALAAERAVVSTGVGIEGFPVENGREVLIADSAAEFASLVLKLLGDAKLRKRIGAQGQQFIQEYDWRIVVPRFEVVYNRILKSDDEGS